MEYLIQYGMFFKGNQLCIPRSSMRLNLIKEKHSGELARHFGFYKTIELVGEKYYWPQFQKYVRKYVQGCKVCQVAELFKTLVYISHYLYL